MPRRLFILSTETLKSWFATAWFFEGMGETSIDRVCERAGKGIWFGRLFFTMADGLPEI
jgi:hypothetical protein